MTLSEFFAMRGRGSMRAMARGIGAPAANLSDWSSRKRPVPVQWCVPIEKASGGLVSRKTLYGEGWEKIWPELE